MDFQNYKENIKLNNKSERKEKRRFPKKLRNKKQRNDYVYCFFFIDYLNYNIII
jgi:hypothetical protein